MPPEFQQPCILSRVISRLGNKCGCENETLNPRVSTSRSSVRRPPGLDDDSATLGVHGNTASLFPGANAFRMGDCHVYVNGADHDHGIDGWKLLLKHIAPNALHDSSVRYDAPRCDEDTRIEITGEIMNWIEDRNGPQRLLCMTGAAGSGKSALQQTIVERCVKSGTLSAALFLSSRDPARSATTSIVPTIAYQIGLKEVAFRTSIAAAVKHNPDVFSLQLGSQINTLIVQPFKNLRESRQIDINTFPYAILIDGLDEYSGEPIDAHLDDGNRSRAEDRQAELLQAIQHCILDNDLPFRILITSRPEMAIRTALEPGGHLHQVAYHIDLSGTSKYDASGDMRRYLQKRFKTIGLQISNPQWFAPDDIDALVKAASGQFISVATVYKYISQPRASPAERLKIVLTWTPQVGQVTRPFLAPLDALYTKILVFARDAYEAVDTHHGRDFLLLFRAYHMNIRGFHIYGLRHQQSAGFFSVHWLGLEAGAEVNLISDLHSLVTLDRIGDGSSQLRLYHESISDFLGEEGRAKDLFVPEARVYTHIAKCLMQRIIECRLDFDNMPDRWGKLPLPSSPRLSLRIAVELLPFFLSSTTIDKEIDDFTQKDGWHKINNLLPLLYRHGLTSAVVWPHDYFEGWKECLRQFTDKMTLQKPELASLINGFVERWDRELKE